MTGDESYHATCFTCRSCAKQIQELVFAKTSNGIYCMNCHNERVARSRRHAEAKKNKSRTGGSSSRTRKESEKGTSSRDRDRSKEVPLTPNKSSNALSPNPTTPSPALPGATSAHGTPSTPATQPPPPSYTPLPTSTATSVYPASNRRASTQSMYRLLEDNTSPSPGADPNKRFGTPPSSRPETSMSGRIATGASNSSIKERPELVSLPSSDSLENSEREGRTRKSYDDGVRPLSHFLNASSSTSLSNSGSAESGLDVPAPRTTSRADKRRSINPGLFLNDVAKTAPVDPGPKSSPSTANIRLSPLPPSPLGQGFGERLGPRSPDSAFFSPSSSPAVDGHHRSRSSSRSPSPAPAASQSAPVISGPSTPPSVAITSATPSHTPGHHASSSSVDFPPRTNSLPNTSGKGAAANGSSHLNGSNKAAKRMKRNSSIMLVMEETDADADSDIVVLKPRIEDEVQFKFELEGDDDAPPPPPKEKPGFLGVEDSETATVTADSPVSSWEDEETSDGFVVPNGKGKQQKGVLAPALPPMRFSISDTDFTELLKSVGGESKAAQSSTKDGAKSISDSPQSSTMGLPSEDLTITIGSKGDDDQKATTPTSIATVTKANRLSVNIPMNDEDIINAGGIPPTPPPSSAMSTSSVTSVSTPYSPTTTNGTGHGRSGTAPAPKTHHNTTLPRKSSSMSRNDFPERARVDSSASLPGGLQNATAAPTASSSLPAVLLTNPDASTSTTSLVGALPNIQGNRPTINRLDSSSSGSNTSLDLVSRRLKEALKDATERGAVAIKLDREFVDAIVRSLDITKEKTADLRGEIDNMKRTSAQYISGMSVAQGEYHKEVAARRDAEAEVTRLRVQLSGQAARLTAMSAEDRRRDLMEQMSRDLSANLSGLEKDVSKLQVERDLALAEVEELSGKAGSPVLNSPEAPSTLSRSITQRFDGLKVQYRKDLEPLRQQREALMREINELKGARDIFLEETTALNARNEELAELNAQIARQIEATGMGDASNSQSDHTAVEPPSSSSEANGYSKPKGGLGLFGGKAKTNLMNAASASVGSLAAPSNSPSFASLGTSGNLTDDGRHEFGSVIKVSNAKAEIIDAMPTMKKFKWFGVAKDKEKTKKPKAHNFVHQNVPRFARCDFCGDKMWGPQGRCTGCGIGCHPKCVQRIQTVCQPGHRDDQVVDIAPLPPSMFGRDLIEQVRSDSKGGDRMVPVIVEKCIHAVEVLAMDYEGIYRKTGGSSQSKAITQLFERGNYDGFDLTNTDSFNDISSVTSVLKTYFRSLPDPLLTFALHDAFISAANLKDHGEKFNRLNAAVRQLPPEHYETLKLLMLHLNRVQNKADENLMTARNLGVVFGPTLMRSSDSTKEFTDMAGKALTVEWLVENAADVFRDP
ncbi:hypothetical protein FRC03_006993 [Tulasnella sp. 419]|nr:hypothetical protein FRC03_006993 [Tulasnella sp. 419]